MNILLYVKVKFSETINQRIYTLQGNSFRNAWLIKLIALTKFLFKKLETLFFRNT